MSNTGELFPGTAATLSTTNGLDWTNPNNIKAADTTYATCAPDSVSTTVTFYIQATNFNFNITAGSTINGVTVQYFGHVSNDAVSGNMREFSALLLKAGTASGSDLGSFVNLTTSDVLYTLGGSSNLWGNTLTTTDVNASNFGVELEFQNTDVVTRTASLDYVTMQIDYTTSSGQTLNAIMFGMIAST